MAEIETPNAGSDAGAKPGEGSAADPKTEGGSDGAGAAPADGQKTDAQPDGAGNGSGEQPKEPPKPTDNEPTVRKRPYDYVRERREARAAKGEGAEADPKAAAAEAVREMIDPIIEKAERDHEDAEVAAFLAKNPEFAEFEAQARKYLAHPSRSQVPVEAVFYEVAGPHLMRIGAARAKAADDEARKTASAGGTGSAPTGPKPVSEMTDAELAQYQEEVRRKLAER